MTYWPCSRCGEEQITFGPLSADRLCHTCYDALFDACAFTEADAGIPPRYRGLTRESWSRHFQRPWPEALEAWTGEPHWLAVWGPTGTGKTSLATVLLAEHLRTGRRGRWISGPELAHRIRLDFAHAEETIAPLLVTSLLVLDEPILGSWDWYMERLTLITRIRDERGLPTILTACRVPRSSAAVFSTFSVAGRSGKRAVPDSAGGGGIRDWLVVLTWGLGVSRSDYSVDLRAQELAIQRLRPTRTFLKRSAGRLL